MTTKADRTIDDVRIASPCSASWDAMTGTDTVRFCGECKLNVYNLSEMTAEEGTALVARAEGRLCVRLYRRSDGTTLTKDCPVGLRAAVRRVSRAAGAALATVFGLFAAMPVRAQDASARMGDVAAPLQGGITPQQARQQAREPEIKMGKIAVVRGRTVFVKVVDENGKPVPGASVALTNLGTGEDVTRDEGDDAGTYDFARVEYGVYTLSVTAEGYDNALPRTLRLKAGAPLTVRVTLRRHARPMMGAVAAPGR